MISVCLELLLIITAVFDDGAETILDVPAAVFHLYHGITLFAVIRDSAHVFFGYFAP